MRNITARTHGSPLRRDLAALKQYLWVPAATLVIAVATALIMGALASAPGDARFRETVAVDALPPLFGPAVTPSPFDYVRLATADDVIAEVAGRTGVSADQLRTRLHAEARFDTPQIEFRVTGGGALSIANAWQAAFNDAVVQQTPAIQRLLVGDYARQLDQARTQLEARAAAAAASPDDAVLAQQLAAAQENYETASRLSQSYDVVANTISATPLTNVAPREASAGVGSTAGRLAAAVAVGLIVGVALALTLETLARRRRIEEQPPAETPAPFRRRQRTT